MARSHARRTTMSTPPHWKRGGGMTPSLKRLYQEIRQFERKHGVKIRLSEEGKKQGE